ncbi:MAG: hypothetical protein IJ690_01580 [Clostridia bacterium]|nr:hypothetical protein [Clostridia bacterium]
MSLKENWTSQDIFTCKDMNDILAQLLKVDTGLSISYPFQRMTRRNVQIGDDLSGKTLHFEFPSNLYNQIINDVGGGQADILVTDEGNAIIEYVNTSNSVATVSINEWMDMLYYANTSTSEVYTNLTEVQLSNDFGVVTEINNLSALQYIYIEDEGLEYKLGDFLTSNILQLLENNLKQINDIIDTSFEKRDWYYLSVITYEDINRWSILLNIAYDEIFGTNKKIITENEEYLTTEDSDYLITEGG